MGDIRSWLIPSSYTASLFRPNRLPQIGGGRAPVSVDTTISGIPACEVVPRNDSCMGKGLTLFGIFCRKHRAQLGLTMPDQAKVMRCSISTISDIETGDQSPSADYVTELER